ncbi:MAG: NADH:ubiquinone reductase (Na(+)-transporting) subunit B [Bacteroidetes bacterium]|jgi:Na+-transporting NADH:ubiquinone oxidoreductase subunit B|nr:NADH:ubiquinone reductase (Na(+)-transporting) subunit B [Bacteroidota bacterium]
MKFLRNTLDKIKPNFEKGGKLHFLHSTFDAIETFMFVPNHTTKRGAHIRDGIDLKRTMFTVVIALVPALLFGMWNVGELHYAAQNIDSTLIQNLLYGAMKVVPIIAVSYLTGLGIEFAFCQVNGHPVNEGFLVSGMLIPLIVPADIPLWMVIVATAFAVIIGKEVFGGTGMNILNPALTARVFLYIAYPVEMAGDIWVSGIKEGIVDASSGATYLGDLGVGKVVNVDVYNAFMGFMPGSIGETSTLMCLIGAVILIASGIGSWRIMLATVIGALGMGLILNAVGGNPYYDLPAYQHLIIGGFAFGAVFMATDPVSAAHTQRGKWIYGILIGVLTVLIRVFNPAYPEGIMFAILFMNVMAPLVDNYVVKANIKRRLNRVKA